MAEIQTTGKGPRTNVELNLVPFIDLMSVLITFLLITAVWTQEAMIQVGSSYSKKPDEAPQSEPEPEVVLKVKVHTRGYTFLLAQQVIILPLKSGVFDDGALLELVLRARSEYPKKIDAAISIADSLSYERLIHVMDAFLKGGFSKLSILNEGIN